MTEFQKKYYEKRGRVLVKNLQSRHFDAYYCENSAAALSKALELIPEGSTVGWGGSLTAEQIGLIDAVRKGNYQALDRAACRTPEERTALFKKSLLADVFLTGANALSMDGEMVNIDGTGNRIAMTAFGPEKVYFLIGSNKITPNLHAAIDRAHNVAAPKNAARFGLDTPCVKGGHCFRCNHPQRICKATLILERPVTGMYAEVLFINEELGF